jgi:hypothetical protein
MLINIVIKDQDAEDRSRMSHILQQATCHFVINNHQHDFPRANFGRACDMLLHMYYSDVKPSTSTIPLQDQHELPTLMKPLSECMQKYVARLPS